MNKDLRIIYMGTPEFAVPSLEILVENGFNVVGVITMPDKKSGRGQKVNISPVKEYALSKNLTILQPEKLKAPEFIAELEALKADLQIVVAFRMLPEIVWNMPRLGTFNLHGSLLPQYRGAAPINWAIINGEKETGVTTFFLQHEIDTGDIIFQEKETIAHEDNVGTVYERLMHKGAQLVLKTVQMIEKNEYSSTPQNLDQAVIKHAPKIFKETCEIDFTKTSKEIYDFIRGLSPYPAAWTTLNEKNCKIFKASLITPTEGEEEINTEKNIITDNKRFLYLKTGDGHIAIEELQIQGKKRMTIQEFLCGNKF